MSTRAAVARLTEGGGWAGRYIHFDGNPTTTGAAVFAIVQRDGLYAASRVLLDENPQGWSMLDAHHGPDSPYSARYREVDGYGLAYGLGEPAMPVTEDDSAGTIQWVYLLGEAALHILVPHSSRWLAVGMVDWEHDLGDAETYLRRIEEGALA